MLKKIYKKIRCLGIEKRDNYKIELPVISPGPIKNIFNQQFKKKALVSFITYAIKQPSENLSHTNILECKTICNILNELEYNVDLIDYNNTELNLENIYDVIIGFGYPIENILFHKQNKNYKLIVYRNGCDQSFSDQATLLRVEEVLKKTGKLLIKSSRISPAYWRAQIRFADIIIVLGNQFVSGTYQNETSGKIISLDLFYYDVGTIDFEYKDFDLARKKFLWFGSLGAIHKGLDIAIEYFSSHHDLELFICGLNLREEDFIELYRQELALPNIHNFGFVELQSKEFKNILNSCCAIITPSVSEGGAAANLNVIAAGGLVPLITKSSGISFDGNEIIIEEITVSALNAAIDTFLKIPVQDLKKKSLSINKYVRDRYTFDNYKKNLRNIISEEVHNRL